MLNKVTDLPLGGSKGAITINTFPFLCYFIIRTLFIICALFIVIGVQCLYLTIQSI